jgi:hypothetical protein
MGGTGFAMKICIAGILGTETENCVTPTNISCAAAVVFLFRAFSSVQKATIPPFSGTWILNMQRRLIGSCLSTD